MRPDFRTLIRSLPILIALTAFAACGEDPAPDPGPATDGGGGGGGDLGGEGGSGGTADGGTGGGGSGGTQVSTPACNLLDLMEGGDECRSCIGTALIGSCQSTVSSCLITNSAAVTCGITHGCVQMDASPPLDVICLAMNCGVELIQLNSCLLTCEDYQGCFL